ncbi:hypothetical protein GUJ93_ZPchr2178g2965 [Zizania palustris]|uniref:Uncharacterized protein n=1 Tax=Zizania palustris TaxID=103762 RepID=A0A8J5R5D9_ZIZPA|nr:hypothetical protein GUJ93_ZPchr2178g2965 [Zizania palustris]
MQPMEAPRFMWWVDEFAAAVAVGALRHTPSRMTKAKAKAPKKRFMSDLFMDAPSLTLPPPADASAPRFWWWADELPEVVVAGAPWPTPLPLMTVKSKATESKKRSMSDLFMAARPLSLPPPTDVTGGNEETDEDDYEALCVIIQRTSKRSASIVWPRRWGGLNPSGVSSERYVVQPNPALPSM